MAREQIARVSKPQAQEIERAGRGVALAEAIALEVAFDVLDVITLDQAVEVLVAADVLRRNRARAASS